LTSIKWAIVAATAIVVAISVSSTGLSSVAGGAPSPVASSVDGTAACTVAWMATAIGATNDSSLSEEIQSVRYFALRSRDQVLIADLVFLPRSTNAMSLSSRDLSRFRPECLALGVDFWNMDLSAPARGHQTFHLYETSSSPWYLWALYLLIPAVVCLYVPIRLAVLRRRRRQAQSDSA